MLILVEERANPTLKFLMASTFYPPYHVGGDANHVEYLVKELANRDHEVHIIHSLDAYRVKQGKQLPRRAASDEGNIFIRTIESPLRALDPLMIYTFGNSFWVDEKFSQAVRAIRPDVVHHHNVSLLGYDLLRKRAYHLSWLRKLSVFFSALDPQSQT